MQRAIVQRPSRAELVDRFSSAGSGVPPLFFVAVATAQGSAAPTHRVQTYLIPAESDEQALKVCQADIEFGSRLEGPGSRVVCQAAAQVQRQHELEVRWADGWTTLGLFNIAQASDGYAWPPLPGEADNFGSHHPRVFAMAATLAPPTADGSGLALQIRFFRARNSDEACTSMRRAMLSEHPDCALQIIEGREIGLKLVSVLRGPAGGTVAEVRTPIRHPITGLISKVITERFG